MTRSPDIPDTSAAPSPAGEGTTGRPSRTRRKREAEDRQRLGERLAGLDAGLIRQLDLPERLREALLEAGRIRARGARRRQLQYIGRLMREVDPAPLAAALERIQAPAREDRQRLHRIEAWRDRLLAEGDSALPALLETWPRADRAHVRRLCRAALAGEHATRARRALFRYLRELDGD